MKEIHEIMRSNVLDTNLYVVKERISHENSAWIYHGKIIVNMNNSFFYDEDDNFMECFEIENFQRKDLLYKKLLKFHEVALKSKKMRGAK